MTSPKSTALVLVLQRGIKALGLTAMLLVLCSGLQQSRIPTALERVQQSGKLLMISRNGPTTYYSDAEGMTGFEYTLAAAFARYLDVELEIIDVVDIGAMLHKLSQREADFVAAGLTVTEKRQARLDFAQPYMKVTQKVIYRSGTGRPDTVEDLIGKRIVVISNSSHEEKLLALSKQHPELHWDARRDAEMTDLLELVHQGEYDITIVDSNAYTLHNALYPRAREAFDLTQAEPLAWAFTKQRDDSLLRAANAFFQQEKTLTLIDDTINATYGDVSELDYGGALLFSARVKQRLPDWAPLLKTAADASEIDWTLLAALSYQESHWNPKAVSPTGVKGFMMLTRATAKELGVRNRLNAEQSIAGGARYFRAIYDRIPERINDPERTWFALAAYNIGLSHLEDARILTERLGGNPDSWEDVKANLPLLAKSKYYKTLKYGYARGWEAVDYVQNIRSFHNILAWHEKINTNTALAATEQQKQQNQDVIYADFNPAVAEAVKTLAVPLFEL